MRPPESWQTARATVAIAAATVACWLVVAFAGLQGWAAAVGGFVPARLNGPTAAAIVAAILTPLTAALIQSGVAHLLFVLAVFLVCGRAVEGVLGARGIVILTLAGLYLSAAAQYAAAPHSTLVSIGASGGVSAIVGAYASMFGRHRVRIANPTLARWVHIAWLLAAWIVINAMIDWTFRAAANPGMQGMGISLAAHVGGFVAGLALQKPLLLLKWRGA
jgi:membrane associated rhomboid family serine protease